MANRVQSIWPSLGSNRPGFPLGTTALLTLIMFVWFGGIQNSVCVGPGGMFPGFQVYRLSLHAFSHEELPSLLYSVILLVWLGRCQEGRWGTVAFICLSLLSTALPVLLYACILFLSGTQTSRICGYSATHLAMFTAQCRHGNQRLRLRWVPVWTLPVMFLLLSSMLLSSTSALLHVCAIFVGHCYSAAVIGRLQQGEEIAAWTCLPAWAFVRASQRDWLPTSSTAQRPVAFPEMPSTGQLASSHRVHWGNSNPTSPLSWPQTIPDWLVGGATSVSDTQLLEEELLRAGILASLQDSSVGTADKVEVPKSSVSSIRLQQLEKMGFPTEKAVVALAATGKLDGAISLLIDDSVGEEAVVTSKGRSSTSPWSS